MRLVSIFSLPLLAAWLGLFPERGWAAEPLGKVIATYSDRNTLKLVLETQDPLVAGRQVFIGPEHVVVTLGDLLSRSEMRYYYSASVPGKPKIEKGDAVMLEAPKTLPAPSILTLKIQENYTFAQKRVAAVTAVQGDHAMLDRGSLHEVRERDLYRIYDSTGHYKGMIELHGVGDLQSSGQLYNALEDVHRRSLKTVPGDKAVFAGQRKLFALGFVGGAMLGQRPKPAFANTEVNAKSFGGGLLWNVTFRDGWAAELLFGGYAREETLKGQPGNPFPHLSDKRSAYYIAPTWLKKSFFYPSVVSPFLAAGVAYFMGKNNYHTDTFALSAPDVGENKSVSTVIPVFGGGIEFFPGRFFRPRLEVRYFRGPNITAAGDTFKTSAIIYSAGCFTTW